MSCYQGCVTQDIRPGTARVVVTELMGHINPTPTVKPCGGSAAGVEVPLSPEKLEMLCGTSDLSQVTSLELRIDTQENSLGNFGAYLPKLAHLKMNNSTILSVRDLGTSLSHLQVLWMSRCSLQDLDGISALSSLRELYLAYNSVTELSQIGLLENLHLLDLEGNDVDDLVQVQYLGLCSKLHTLSLEGNPVCVQPNPTVTQTTNYSYRAAVRELVPQLCYLDDIRVEDEGQGCSTTTREETVILRNCIRRSSLAAAEEEVTAASAYHNSRPTSSSRPASGIWPLSSAGSRPTSATSRVLSPPASRPGSADSDSAAVEADTSILTHGAGKILFCGNPIQAIRARREKLKTAPTRSTFTSCLPIHVPERMYEQEEPDVTVRDDVFAELRSWREQHSRRLQALKTERLPQVLAIKYSDEEGDDEEGCGDTRNDLSDEDYSEDSLVTSSPDSSFQSLYPESLLIDAARLSLSPDTTLRPSPPPPPPPPPPPLSATAASGVKRLPGLRKQRLRLNQTSSGHFPLCSSGGRHSGSAAITANTDLTLNNQIMPSPPCKPHPPTRSNLVSGLTESCADMDSPTIKAGSKHQMTKLLDRRQMITRPHTAAAVLQKHHQQHSTLQPCRGSSQPD